MNLKNSLNKNIDRSLIIMICLYFFLLFLVIVFWSNLAMHEKEIEKMKNFRLECLQDGSCDWRPSNHLKI